ncbi:MAG: fumarate hydratase, partial [Deltaproteobacteria bacterium]|nr:fumarate hydratase [Deltaproteobacteria bacterium]
MTEFAYEPMYSLGEDRTSYRLLTDKYVSTGTFEGSRILKVEPEALVELARQGFSDINFFFRTSHLESLRAILDDPEASGNDRYVALTMLKNAVISAGGVLPSCQDTGTAKVYALKGQQVWTGFDEAEAFSRGVFRAYGEENLRYSMNAPISLYEEVNTRTNLPAQVDVLATGGDALKTLFIAKGGGSANKMFLFQETKAILNPETLPQWLSVRLKMLGTAACPPYHLALVVGGHSAETTTKTLSLATAGYLDNLPAKGTGLGGAIRDREMEAQLAV